MAKGVSASRCDIISPATIKVVWGENDVFITLDDENMLTARLIGG